MRHAHLDHRRFVLVAPVAAASAAIHIRCSDFPASSKRATARPQAPQGFLWWWSFPPSRPRRRFGGPASRRAKFRRRARPGGAVRRACRRRRKRLREFRAANSAAFFARHNSRPARPRSKARGHDDRVRRDAVRVWPQTVRQAERCANQSRRRPARSRASRPAGAATPRVSAIWLAVHRIASPMGWASILARSRVSAALVMLAICNARNRYRSSASLRRLRDFFFTYPRRRKMARAFSRSSNSKVRSRRI